MTDSGQPGLDTRDPQVEPPGRRIPAAFGEPGEFFFHYTTASSAFQFILPSRTLRMSPYPQMRDPMESKQWEFTSIHAEDASLAREISDALNQARDRATLLSLTIDAPGYSGDPDAAFGRGYSRARMWEHYAENHAGVCLCLERPAFIEKAVAHLTGTWPHRHGAVRYTAGGSATSPARTLPTTHLATRLAGARKDAAARLQRLGRPPTQDEIEALSAELAQPINDELTAVITKHLHGNIDDLFFLKTDDWSSEHEYRLVAIRDEPGYIFVPLEGSLRAVILGERFPGWQLPAAAEACRRASAEMLQMRWHGGVPTPERVELADEVAATADK